MKRSEVLLSYCAVQAVGNAVFCRRGKLGFVLILSMGHGRFPLSHFSGKARIAGRPLAGD